MTTYNGRRGPNLTQFLREDLNVIPGSEPSPEDTFAIDEDLAKFTNTNFFDFDSGQNTDFQPQAQDVKPDTAEGALANAADETLGDFSNFDLMTGDFGFPEFASPSYGSASLPNFADGLGNLQPIQPNPQAAFPTSSGVNHFHHPGGYANGSSASSGSDAAAATPRGPGSVERGLNGEELGRVAAEEDKRRRNTAASARFRVKKKQREQALEKSAKEMTEKVTALEGRISQLETENRWLKNLIMEKNSGKDEESVISALMREKEKEAATGGAKSDSKAKNAS